MFGTRTSSGFDSHHPDQMINIDMRWWEILEAVKATSALQETPIEPTTSFLPFHGNYCGPGNRGGAPIDALDKACFRHDCEYDRSYKEEGESKLHRQREADQHFIDRALKVSRDKTMPRVVRLKAYAAAQYFKTRLLKY